MSERIYSFNTMVKWISITANLDENFVYSYLVIGDTGYFDEYEMASIKELKMEWMLD
jgi:hypothetical protein